MNRQVTNWITDHDDELTDGRDGLTSLNIVSAPIIPCPANDFQRTGKILEYFKGHFTVVPQRRSTANQKAIHW
jgi:hypothetical protein